MSTIRCVARCVRSHSECPLLTPLRRSRCVRWRDPSGMSASTLWRGCVRTCREGPQSTRPACLILSVWPPKLRPVWAGAGHPQREAGNSALGRSCCQGCQKCRVGSRLALRSAPIAAIAQLRTKCTKGCLNRETGFSMAFRLLMGT